MSYVPPHKRQTKGSPSLNPTPAPESLSRSVFNKRKDNKFRTRNLGYTDHTILKWFSVGLADELRFSSLVSFQSLSPESFETKAGLQPLSLVSTHQGCNEGIKNELIDTPWLLIAANVKKDLLLSFQHMKREMEEADMAQVKSSVVARFGTVLFYGISSICKDSLKLNSLTETTLRKMKGSFHTDVPPSYMDYVENRVVENLGLEYWQGKELYYVKLSDNLRTESTVSCKCIVAKDHNKIQLYKIELNRVRQMVADMSILGKSSDLIKIDEEINEIKDLIGSAILDSELPGGLRWPLNKRHSSGGRYVVNVIGHTTAKSYRNSSIRFKFRHANRSKFKSSTGEVTQEIFLKLPGIVSELHKQTMDEDVVFEMLKNNLKLMWDLCLLDGSNSQS
ncbi:uncharacterized protein [Solanum tuberosum]|uniref:uncharacterized protein n=1 Tax=Solanum tuberosum TaxID=4113 RepID=UPI00073A0B2A|nr:PREDICTED: uncharacterized protein LOC102585540 [Solanum tuberosum]